MERIFKVGWKGRYLERAEKTFGTNFTLQVSVRFIQVFLAVPTFHFRFYPEPIPSS